MVKKEECRIEGCKRPVRAKGYCRVHYNKWRRGEYGKARYKICRVEECTRPRFQKAFCEEHFKSEFLKKPAEETGA